MIKRQSKSRPSWTDVKAKLASFDRAGLLGLIQNLYGTHQDNRTFLHARLGLGEDVLEPYKQTIDRWLWPDAFRKEGTSVAKAKQAISNYKKAVSDPAGLAKLMAFYCERASGFASDVGYQDESYFNALVRMFDQAVATANTLQTDTCDALIARLDRVRSISHKSVMALETTWTPSLPSTPSARTVHPSADKPDSSSVVTFHARLKKTH
jgi:hypothetical protein